MLKDYVITEKDMSQGGKDLRIHVIDSDKFNYREIGSFSAFFHSLKQRHWIKGVKMFYAVVREEHDHSLKSYNKIMATHGVSPQTILEVHHANIWEFFKHIGYDYKTQKWHVAGKLLTPKQLFKYLSQFSTEERAKMDHLGRSLETHTC